MKKKIQYQKMPSTNGRSVKYYLKPDEIDFINQRATELDEKPSVVLRQIIQTYKKVRFLIQEKEVK